MEEFNELINRYFFTVGGELYWKIKHGRKVKAGAIAGTSDNKGYRQVMLKGKLYFVHRIIYELETGKNPGKLCIDHINGDGCDNRIENLRLSTIKENNSNQYKHREGKLIGCCYYKTTKKYKSYIVIDKKQKHIGYFMTEQEAHSAYKTKQMEVSCGR